MSFDEGIIIPREELAIIELASKELDCEMRAVADPFGIRPDRIERRLEQVGHQVIEGQTVMDVLKEHYPALYKAIDEWDGKDIMNYSFTAC